MAKTQEFRLEGIETVMANLNEELRKIKGRSVKGLIGARIILQQAMDHQAPKIPVYIGNLRHSFFAVITGRGVVEGASPMFEGNQAAELASNHAKVLTEAEGIAAAGFKDPVMVLGFSANYAIWVHEMMQSPTGKAINWNRPGSGPKYFESHLKRLKAKMLEEIRKEAYIR